MSEPLLRISNLEVGVKSGHRDTVVVEKLSLSISPGEMLGLVGESGCGKSMTLRAILGLLPPRARILGGQVLFRGEDLAQASQHRLREVRGREIGMIFQEPMTALNPVMRVGDQITEGGIEDCGWNRREARRRAAEVMRTVGIPEPEQRVRAYPHELSGGLRQRVMIAMVLLRDPWLILCDEPTTALDVTIQKQILGLLLSLRKKTQVALVLVTHDLAVVAETCQTVVVMYAGRVVETGTVDRVFSEPRHPYTLGLLRSLPDIGLVADTLESIPGKPPDLANPPDGCRFHPRCRFREEDCVKGDFPLLPLSDGRTTACIHHEACATSHSPSRVGAHA